MSEKKSATSKLKLVLSDESSEDDEKDSGNDDDDDIGLSLDKLNLGPKKKLLVLCLGGLLVHRVHLRNQHSVRGLRPDVVYGKFLVFKRPFCTEFLKFCFERFDVALWSSAREHNIEGVLSNITGGTRSKLVFIWGQEECTESGYQCLHKEEKPLFLKELKDIWEHKYYKGQYSATNTLLIDDEPHTSLAQSCPNGELRKYLDGLADAKDVPTYVKDHPIGQTPITPSHPDWSYYAKIARRFGKKEDEAESSAK
ncbi:hypothetical protein PHJA_000957200 [Phtheirospermum japonicum]|uniref:Mitochondrial import inner membrane translocase subunit TIM50 n=1 Tax=Phtheirospermum japonicum TaxID=374723 RepID=A0A830BXP2_9LAMI|nr:hypothetical protein PHJA_000957200 [Phtheirospermum japonicum]